MSIRNINKKLKLITLVSILSDLDITMRSKCVNSIESINRYLNDISKVDEGMAKNISQLITVNGVAAYSGIRFIIHEYMRRMFVVFD